MKKVLFFLKQMENSRHGRDVRMLSSEMSKKGIETVIILAGNLLEKEEDRQLLLRSADVLFPGRIARQVQKKLKQVIKYEKPDVAVAFGYNENYWLLAAAKGSGVPVVATMRKDPLKFYGDKRQKAIGKKYFQMAAGMIFQTREAMDYFPEELKKNAAVLEGFVDEKYSNWKKAGTREKRIVCAGGFKESSNQILLAQMFAALSGKYPEYKLEFYGEQISRNAFLQTRELVSERHLQDRILFMEKDSDTGERISNAAFFVSTDAGCGIPVNLLNAMALQLPVLAVEADYNGAKEVIDDGVNGLLIEAKNAKEMKLGLEKFMENPDIVEGFAEQAGKITEKYSQEIMAQHWIEFLEKTVG